MSSVTRVTIQAELRRKDNLLRSRTFTRSSVPTYAYVMALLNFHRMWITHYKKASPNIPGSRVRVYSIVPSAAVSLLGTIYYTRLFNSLPQCTYR
eukprot:scaffold437_cov288-Chaetoceros_neogracile.AAC.46